MSRAIELSLSAQTAYAQVLEAAIGADLTRSVGSLTGSFARKSVKGREYWYFQFTGVTGKLHQVYLGPAGPAIEALMEARDRRAAPALEPLARSAEALGVAPVLPRHFRVIRRLGEYGFFRAGGVLVGTHAFLAHGAMLGVRWQTAARTQDVDFAHAGKDISIGLPTNVDAQVATAIESLGMGLLPFTTLAGAPGPTYLNPKDPEFRLDFLTTRGRGGDAPYPHPRLGVTVQPLAFMEYLLEGVVAAALLCAEGAVVVTVPHPARYALHKLIIAGERSVAFQTKSRKDLEQAAALLGVLRDGRKDEVDSAWQDLVGRGPGWRRRAHQGRNALHRLAPELDVPTWLADSPRRDA